MEIEEKRSEIKMLIDLLFHSSALEFFQVLLDTLSDKDLGIIE